MADTKATAGGAGRPVLIGEVLFDCFEDGSVVLGGAPFNVAWHLQGFGLRPLLVSRVGEDPLGERLLAAMAGWGMDTAGIQRDPRHPTGTVQVRLGEDGQPAFDIVADAAWDHIDAAAAAAAARAAGPALLYHGSLAARAAPSRAAIEALRRLGAPTFVDVNLRPPWWSQEGVETLLAGARWIKLNDEELGALAAAGAGGPAARARRLRGRFGAEAVLLTLGAQGAMWVGADGECRVAPPPVGAVADTVGAGDAFAAVALLGLLAGWPAQVLVARAVAFAAEVCTVRGATIDDPAVYRRHREAWA
ncbi:PfkB family carbohydrate kinase [Inmirania thermothiophila]|uniref:Fructokinase n=1 Tax=Inmirania thermothiophila TaxID=1750597 RepID=A0A3N1Y693_9GAMM|nr:PfkB family carbohydrate kinase [Inmirania thermothiophila]ROR34323.1 fructokinase [Inmirania thermothiophila]